jgi:hypothetical protein
LNFWVWGGGDVCDKIADVSYAPLCRRSVGILLLTEADIL